MSGTFLSSKFLQFLDEFETDMLLSVVNGRWWRQIRFLGVQDLFRQDEARRKATGKV